MSNKDTIAAIATGGGSGGVGIIRISGPQALACAQALFHPASPAFTHFQPRYLHLGWIKDEKHGAERPLDQVMLAYMPGPHSYTGEDVVEIQAHGGPALLQCLLDAVLEQGLRLAQPGEFTRRAFLNGRMDLSQAEAVAELISAPSAEGARLSAAKLQGLLGKKIEELRHSLEHLRQSLCADLDFSAEAEDVDSMPPETLSHMAGQIKGEVDKLMQAYERAKPWQEGVLVVLAGQVNAGKSSLMNALLGRPRSIVTPVAGTTRDYVEEHSRMAGLPVRLVDTAGLRPGLLHRAADALPHNVEVDSHQIELEGIRRSRELLEQAQIVVLVLNGAAFEQDFAVFAEDAALLEHIGPERCLVVWNKCDTVPENFTGLFRNTLQGALWQRAAGHMGLSAKQGQGLEELALAVRKLAAKTQPEADELAPNARQAHALKLACQDLEELERAVLLGIPPDVCALHLDAAAAFLEEITGLNSTEETINAVFESFCIGK